LLVGSSLPLGATALVMPAMTAVAIGSAPEHRIGLASGILNAARQTGGALGVAVLGALLSEHGSQVALHLAFVVIACAYTAGLVLAVAGQRMAPPEITTGLPGR
jgi:DHA2 family methylenomycin A resistance protein-like MFS transporter